MEYHFEATVSAMGRVNHAYGSGRLDGPTAWSDGHGGGAINYAVSGGESGERSVFEYINCEREKSMKSVVICMIAASLMVGGSAMATDMPAIAKKNECNACHAIDKKVVGPAWMDIARKYKGDATAKDRLTAKILKGGGGVWGAMPMPGNPKLSEADAAMLANFILGLAK